MAASRSATATPTWSIRKRPIPVTAAASPAGDEPMAIVWPNGRSVAMSGRPHDFGDRRRCPYPHGAPAGQPQELPGHGAGCRGHPGGAGTVGRVPRSGAVRDHGAGAPGQRRADGGPATYKRPAPPERPGGSAGEPPPGGVPKRRGERLVSAKEGGTRRDPPRETLARRGRALGSEGTIPAGTSSPISDGAAAV